MHGRGIRRIIISIIIMTDRMITGMTEEIPGTIHGMEDMMIVLM